MDWLNSSTGVEKKIKNKKLLITGASGFVGRALTNLSLEKGLSVIATTRKRGASFPGCSSVFVDLSQRGWTKKLQVKPDFIIHLAQSAQESCPQTGNNDLLFINIDSTVELLEWACRYKVQRFVFASTGSVYKPNKKILTEKSETNPRNFYSCSKYCSEKIAQTLSNKIEVSIARLFAIYGPGQKKGLFYNLIDNVKNQKPIILKQNSGLIISPTFISDCAKFLYFAATHKENLPLFNLAGNESVSLKNLSNEIAKKLKKIAIFQSIDETPEKYVADNKLAKKHFGINYEVSLNRGITKMIDEKLENKQ